MGVDLIQPDIVLMALFSWV